ncbi:MAG: D-alanyl-D-alanine carboxypeptidase/D-alanyl-D-alanine-endopeptidase [Thermohalobaculum sp.]|nr:D-alanyl-D-alanine carboxypeptidase/D-alanyl-D-alanine-endopeptidase [Thermohalobaculum sp.]
MSNAHPGPDLLRRGLLAGALASAGTAALANAPLQSIRPAARRPDLSRVAQSGAERIIAGSGVTGAVAFAVLDARTGALLEGRAPEAALPPASSLKAITAQYALTTLGPARRFATRVLATGPLEEGVLRGDLVLVGGGDPTLDTPALAALVGQLRTLGLQSVEGRLIVDESALPALPLIDPEQSPHAGYNPGLSGLNLNFNRVFFEWRRNGAAYDVTMDARAGSYRPRVGVTRMRVVDRGAPVYTYGEEQGGAEAWTVARSALGDNGGRWLPVRRSGAYAGDVFRALAAAQQIALPEPVAGAAPRGAAVLARVESPPLTDILRDMLEFSTNVTAEVLGLGATVARGVRPHSLDRSASAMADWLAERHQVQAERLVDHSGLGDGSRISPAALAGFLASAGQDDGLLRPLLHEVRFRDGNGRHIPNHPVNAVAKTGTLNFVSALAGYAEGPGGRPLAFAILGADLPRRAKIAPENRDRPMGARPWAVRSRRMQQRLIEAWVTAHG